MKYNEKNKPNMKMLNLREQLIEINFEQLYLEQQMQQKYKYNQAEMKKFRLKRRLSTVIEWPDKEFEQIKMKAINSQTNEEFDFEYLDTFEDSQLKGDSELQLPLANSYKFINSQNDSNTSK